MKIGIFTDSHYSSVVCGIRQNNKSLEKIGVAFECFARENCELAVCLGDMIDHDNNHEAEKANLKSIADVISDYGIECKAVMGNHDAFAFEREEFYSILGETFIPENIYTDSVNLIFLDACWFKSGIHYMPGDTDWTDTYYPGVDELRDILDTINGDAYIFMHQNIDPEIENELRLYNDAEIREVLEQSGKVKAVFQGHCHTGSDTTVNDIRYITYPAVCENDDAYYIAELTEDKMPLINKCKR